MITHADSDDREYHISGKQVAMVAEMANECGEHFVVVRATPPAMRRMRWLA